MAEVTSLDRYLGDLRVDIESALERVLAASSAPSVVGGPMRYALIAPGKPGRASL